LTEHIAESHGYGTFSSKAAILGTPGNDLRLVAVVGELDDDLRGYNLEKIDQGIDFNGTHSGEIYNNSCLTKTGD
jgi:hypothetical protein